MPTLSNYEVWETADGTEKTLIPENHPQYASMTVGMKRKCIISAPNWTEAMRAMNKLFGFGPYNEGL
jgi:hypothetical protein